MELKGLNLIKIALEYWLKKYNFSARIRKMDTDFFWYWSDNTISYSLFTPEEAMEPWADLLNELGCKYNIDVFFSSFLHELGHSATYYEFDDDEIDACDEIKALLRDEPSSFAEDVHWVYFHLPVEIEATRWAVNYINTYPERVKELIDLVGKTVRLFYKLNDVVDEDSFDF